MRITTGAARRIRRTREVIATRGDLALFGRMLGWSVLLSVLKYAVPLPRLVGLVTWRSASGTAYTVERITTLARWACLLTRVSRRGRCLERGLITFRYLAAIRVHSRLVVGISAAEANGSRGHAWVEVAGAPVGESLGDIAPFTPILAFDVNGASAVGRSPSHPAATR